MTLLSNMTAAGATLIALRSVGKNYPTPAGAFQALSDVDLDIRRGEFVAIVGASGSGKSTLLNLLGGIDRASSGEIAIDGQALQALTENQLSAWRGRRVGIVFQFFQLLPTLSALENAALPMDFARRWKRGDRWDRARRHLDAVGLADKADHLPLELSGGEQQRVAIARALACDPKLLVGDEPTGNLDSETGGEMLDLLCRLNAAGTTVLYVTHDMALAGRAQRIVTIKDGRVVADQRP